MPAPLAVGPLVPAGLPVLLAQAGQALVAPGLDQAAKPANPVANVPGAQMAQNFANAPAGGAPAPAAPAATTGSSPVAALGSAPIQKLGASVLIVLALIGLGLVLVCRPYAIPEDKMD